MYYRNKYLITLLMFSWLLLSFGCSISTIQYINSFGKFSEEENNYVTVHVRRNFRFSHFDLFVMEFASKNNHTGVLGVQNPLCNNSSGAMLWTNSGSLGYIFGELLITLPNETVSRHLGQGYLYLLSAKKEYVPKIVPASYNDILTLFGDGESECVYPVKNHKYVKNIHFNKVAIIGTVASKDILTWKRPPGNFHIAVLFTRGYRASIFLSDILDAAPGESLYIDLTLSIVAHDIIRGWSSKDIFKSVSKDGFK